MRVSEIDYNLPARLIAQEPLADRSASRMLVLARATGKIEHRKFTDIVGLLNPGDLLVLNDTRVSAVRLRGRRMTGGAVEALIMRPLGDGCFEAMLKPSKRLKPGITIQFDAGIEAEVVEGGDEITRVLRFPPGSDQKVLQSGSVPLPPYIHRDLEDAGRYQTVYNRSPGSAAAPTAGLHFTPSILESLKRKGVDTAFVTLSVGLDTFRPLTVDDPQDHRMHGEECTVSGDTARKVAECNGRVIAVGTTSARTLESHAIGKRLVEPSTAKTKIFIRPGYDFQVIDGLLTNFHMPRTTMLLMLAALVGIKPLMQAYAEAVQHEYRFLSFGDAMLVI